MKMRDLVAGLLIWLFILPLPIPAQVVRPPGVRPGQQPRDPQSRQVQDPAKLARLRREMAGITPFGIGLTSHFGNVSIVKVEAPQDPTLKQIADRAATLITLAAEKAAAHASDPRGYPLPSDRAALENIFHRRLQSLQPRNRDVILRKVRTLLNEPEVRRVRRLGELGSIDLRSASPIQEQLNAKVPRPYAARLTRDRLDAIVSRLQRAAILKSGGAARPNRPPLGAVIGSTLPLQRFYSVTNHDHFFTTDLSELSCGKWGQVNEGIAAHVYDRPQIGTVPMYRYVSEKLRNHAFSLDAADAALQAAGYRQERVAGHVYPQATGSSKPIHWYYRQQVPGMSTMFSIPNFGNDNFYTLTRDDAGLAQHGYSFKGIVAYALEQPRGPVSYTPAKRLEFYIDSFICGRTTGEIGKDEMTIGGIAVRAAGDTFRLPDIKMGDFSAGDVTNFDPSRMWAAFDLNEGGSFPKSYFVTSYLVENDNGGFSDFMNENYTKLREYVAAELNAALATAATAAAGPAGTAAAILIAPVVSYAVEKAFAEVKSWWEDDFYNPTTYQITVRSNEAANGQETVCSYDSWTMYDSRYYMTYHWRLGN